jgi:hypothetical protein
MRNLKIINVDNFDTETRSDILVCENIGEFYGKDIVKFLNQRGGLGSMDYFKLVPDDYVLYVWED